MKLSIVQLGAVEINPSLPPQVISHIDECESCQKEYSHLRASLSSEQVFDVPNIQDSLWENLPLNVLAKVNELKKDIESSKQVADTHIDQQILTKDTTESNSAVGKLPTSLNEDESLTSDQAAPSVSDLSDYRQQPKSEIPAQAQQVVKKSPYMKVILPIAASILIVVAVLLVIPKSTGTFQQQVANFQMALSKTNNLSEKITQIEVEERPLAIFSFATQARPTSGFVVGSYYSESLALLDSPASTASLNHLQKLHSAMIAEGSSSDVTVALQNSIEAIAISGSAIPKRRDAITAFSVSYSDYLEKNNPEDLVYYRLGMWTVNIALAASIKSELVRNEIVDLDYFVSSLTEQSAALGVINCLKDMRFIIDQPSNVSIDYAKLYRENSKLRQLLL